MRNRRTRILEGLTGGSFRLSSDDKAFLRDLAKVRLISEDDADATHFAQRKTKASKRLDKLVEQGLLSRKEITIPGKGVVKAYTFGSEDVAKSLGSKLPKVNRMRNAYHELIVSRLYFAEGRPASFKIEAEFTNSDIESIRQEGQSISEVARPDALFTNAQGQVVVVEADSGQYNSTQIKEKINSWKGFPQVWGQPEQRKSAVENFSSAKVHRF